MDLTPFPGPPAAPPEVPGFRLYELLGFGAHGEVWRAEDLITGDEVALKIGRRCEPGPDENPYDGGASEGGVGERADRETALLSRIEHPHIVRLRRVVALPDENLALVLDLAAGGSLAALVAARGPLTPQEVVTMAIPIVSALEHLHMSGLTHGDVSPGNLLFAADGCPQLGDLGVARVLGERHEEAWSTPGFTDPRLITAAQAPPVPAEVLQAADLWALAACCWFALTGRAPTQSEVEGQPGVGRQSEVGRQLGVEGQLGVGAQPDVGRQREVEGQSEVEGQRHELQTLLVRSLSADVEDRPDLAEFADLAWRAARPVPIRLERGPGGSGDSRLSSLEMQTTKRVTQTAPVSSTGSWSGSLNGGDVQNAAVAQTRDPRRRTVPASRLLVLLVAIGLVGAVTVGVGWRLLRSPSPGGGSAEVAARAADRGPVAEKARVGGDDGQTKADGAGAEKKRAGKVALRVELAQALAGIGKARAQAFEMVSARQLALANETGSPADRADRALLKRLQTTGYRLEDVAFRIDRVRVLQSKGRTAEVSARVSTAAHRQARIGGDYAAGVPATEPAVMIFTLRAVGEPGEGAGRWRVRDIRAPT
ncbi:hypothetical protein Kisp01_56940 [Kineosporia sp. NBRC 101677]|uniref:serine/threonine-protein kinase n=1 Tax=Kineosporia sp. NBRC 101677 TaxID=3032197 RepID=UPI0024A4F69C|nr:protein kinase [Kineosporia sp. NBRC 101677]GLY18680.1 hypothetical protein Kisp01_56940 [Kineosporia sp. NBRC 101677]